MTGPKREVNGIGQAKRGQAPADSAPSATSVSTGHLERVAPLSYRYHFAGMVSGFGRNECSRRLQPAQAEACGYIHFFRIHLPYLRSDIYTTTALLSQDVRLIPKLPTARSLRAPGPFSPGRFH